MRRALPFLLLSGLCLFCWQCSTNLAGGGSSEAEGFTVYGRIVDSARRPLSGAKVALFAAAPLIKADSAATAIDSTHTEADGRFSFKRVPKGRYSLLASAEGSELAALRSGIEVAGNDTLEHLALGRAAVISGNLPLVFPYARAKHIVLRGTPYRSAVSADGSFSITGVMAGSYILALVLHSNFTVADAAVIGALDTVAVEPGASMVFDSLRIRALAGTGPFLVDDFADCDLRNSLRGIWWSTNDRGQGGNSKVQSFTAAGPEDGAPGCAARFAFTFGRLAPYPFVGIGTYLLPHADSLPQPAFPQAVNLEKAAGISFRAKGRGAGLEVLLQSSVSGIVSGQGFDLAQVPETWTTFTINFLSDMKNTYDSTDIRSWQQRKKAITHIQFDAVPIPGVDSGEVWIDDLQILPL